jgi:hypothetical protein
MTAAVRRPTSLPTERLGQALRADVRAIIVSGLHEARQQALAHWQDLPGGAGLIEASRCAPADRGTELALIDRRADDLVRQWQAVVLNAVEATPAQRTMAGRTLSLRPESVAVLVTLVSFIPFRPVTGPAVTPVAGVPAAELSAEGPGTGELPGSGLVEGVSLARRVLHLAYGEPAVKALLDTTREDLRARVEELLNAERSGLKALLDGANVRPGVSDALHTAVKVVEDAR